MKKRSRKTRVFLFLCLALECFALFHIPFNISVGNTNSKDLHNKQIIETKNIAKTKQQKTQQKKTSSNKKQAPKSNSKAKYFKQSMTIAGVKREYYIYIPKSLKKGQKAPAVITFHGFESDANGMRWLIEPDKWAEQYGYIMIYPNAINKSWNAGKGFGTKNSKTDDLSFAAALPDVIIARHPVDKNRIYTMGFSNGAQMSALMYCKISSKISAAALVAHTMNIPKCNPKYKVPIAVIHGQKDTLAPYYGGGKHQLSSHKQTVEFLRKVNGTMWKPKTKFERKTVKCTEDLNYNKKSAVVACTAFNAGHSWPGGKEFKTELFGKTNKELNANKFLFDFFKRFKNKPEKRKTQKLIAIGKPNKKPNNKKPTSKNKEESKVIAANNNSYTGNNIARRPLKLKYHELTINKKKRKYSVLLPDIDEPLKNQAIHVVFAPQQIKTDQIANLIEAKRMGEIYRSVFAFPIGNWAKSNKDSMDFIARMLQDIRDRYVPESYDTYALAYSDGAYIAQLLYCQEPHLISAYSFISYSWKNMECNPVMHPPIMLTHSKQDKRHTYKGDKKKNTQSYTATLSQIKSYTKDILEKESLVKANDHRCTYWRDRNQLFKVLSCTVDWGGNTIPGSRGQYPAEYGKVMPKLPIIRMSLSFFKEQGHHGYTVIRQR